MASPECKTNTGRWCPRACPAVVPSAKHIPFNQWCVKMGLVQSAMARPKSIDYFYKEKGGEKIGLLIQANKMVPACLPPVAVCGQEQST